MDASSSSSSEAAGKPVMMSKSEKIQQLVQQMKAGEISKSELFVQLSALQRGSRNGAADQPDEQEDNSGGEEGANEQEFASSDARTNDMKPAGQKQGSSGLSNPERRAMIIQRLFEEKRRQRHGISDPPGHECLPTQELSSNADSGVWAEGSRVSTQSLLLAEQEVSMSERERERVAQVRKRQQELLLEEHAKRSGGGGSPLTSQNFQLSNATPSGAALSVRARRFQQELVEKQQAECTFSPEIHRLPDEYGMTRASSYEQDLKFESRVNRWKARKLEEMERLRLEKEQNELKGCTFTPKINRYKGGRSSRPGTPQPRRKEVNHTSSRPMTPDGRRSASSASLRPGSAGARSTASSKREGVSAHIRLYENSKTDRRAELQRQYLAAEEAKLAEECTFKPDIGKQPFAVRARYMSGSPRHGARPTSAGPGGRRLAHVGDGASSAGSSSVRRVRAWDADLTFSPQTNPVHPNMQAAQVYLQKDIVSRLTLPRKESPQAHTRRQQQQLSRAGKRGSDENAAALGNQERTFDDKEDRVIDVSTFLSSSAHNGGHFQALQDPNKRQQTASQEKARLTPEEVATRRKSFDQFLVRQQQQEVRKQRKIEQVAKQIAQSHQPELCKKSVEIFNKGHSNGAKSRSGSFLDRVARGALKKEHDTVRRKSQNDPECTFAPRINETSRRKPARSALEMSRGDSLKKETKSRLIKLRREQEESQDLTFTPQLETTGSQVAGKAEGRLKILSEPETYIRRLQHKTSLHSNKANKVAQEQEMKELEECTFRPQIHEAPAYVKRIVRSLALAKPARDEIAEKRAQNQRPEWR